jgi:hypothetical protein
VDRYRAVSASGRATNAAGNGSYRDNHIPSAHLSHPSHSRPGPPQRQDQVGTRGSPRADLKHSHFAVVAVGVRGRGSISSDGTESPRNTWKTQLRVSVPIRAPPSRPFRGAICRPLRWKTRARESWQPGQSDAVLQPQLDKRWMIHDLEGAGSWSRGSEQSVPSRAERPVRGGSAILQISTYYTVVVK